MSFKKAMEERYTVKKYNANEKLSEEQIADLKEILRLSPSSINSQPWKFTFVSDLDTKKQLAEASFFNAPKVLDCDTVVVFSAINNVDLFEKQINVTLPEGSIGYYNDFLKPLPSQQLHAWFEKQTYLAIGVLLSACAEMGIDSTPMEGIVPEQYNAILGEDNYNSLVAVAIGVRSEEDRNHVSTTPKSRRPLDEVVMAV
ncbi:MAG: NAD(P)H-dependent oxidoreductase [Flavobacteriales bacterium]|nr:NAD(P)H-dependent oxidoreductase [Flavobacteriales bacterium]MDG2245585.1 NAD(P)H-dependent oxidoreductase [Flavobacteriales bacterium]